MSVIPVHSTSEYFVISYDAVNKKKIHTDHEGFVWRCRQFVPHGQNLQSTPRWFVVELPIHGLAEKLYFGSEIPDLRTVVRLSHKRSNRVERTDKIAI